MNKYKDTMSQILASDSFKSKTLQILEKELKEESRYIMKAKQLMIGLAACAVLAVGITGYSFKGTNQAVIDNGEIVLETIDLRDRIVIDPNAPAACVIANIEGVITEMSEDGMSFQLDNGKWVDVTADTVIGLTVPTAVSIDEQFIEPTFRVGNSIAGFTSDESSDRITADAIYTNWNWENPIR